MLGYIYTVYIEIFLLVKSDYINLNAFYAHDCIYNRRRQDKNVIKNASIWVTSRLLSFILAYNPLRNTRRYILVIRVDIGAW